MQQWITEFDKIMAPLSLDLSEGQKQQFFHYQNMLQKWNKIYNLTAIKTQHDILQKHFFDCLAIAPILKHERVLDVGTGAGFPGLVLAICYPDQHFTLLDSNNKKAHFLLQASVELKLSNVSVVENRVELYRTERLFPAIVSRAYASLQEFIDTTKHLIAPAGQWFAMKAELGEVEREQLPAGFQISKIHSLPTADNILSRTLVVLQPENTSNSSNSSKPN